MSGIAAEDSDELQKFLALDLFELILNGDESALEEITDYLLRRSRAIRDTSSMNGAENASPHQCHEAADLLVKGVDTLERIATLAKFRATRKS